jgi:hypothetical protein
MTEANEDNLPTSKLENLVFKRPPPSPLKVSQEKVVKDYENQEDVVIEIPDIKVDMPPKREEKEKVDLA